SHPPRSGGVSESASTASRPPLPEQRRALARALLGKRGRAGSRELARITPREERGPAPLSFSQERLWFLDRWNPGSSFYNVPIGLRLRGALNAAALEVSLDAVVERHEVLRSTFPLIDCQPYQVAGPALRAGLPV